MAFLHLLPTEIEISERQLSAYWPKNKKKVVSWSSGESLAPKKYLTDTSRNASHRASSRFAILWSQNIHKSSSLENLH